MGTVIHGSPLRMVTFTPPAEPSASAPDSRSRPAVTEQLSQRYLLGLAEARVKTAPPLIVLHRLTEIVFDRKLSHRFAVQLTTVLTPAVLDGLDLLFARLRGAGAITVVDPAWCRRVYLALLHEVHDLPADSPALASSATGDETDAKVNLLVRTALGALGGSRDTTALSLNS
ncbi:hypothetical protein [Actinoallomurus vinaceus]|uniref:hypothetical protein n=1 Tax=Actinoallomurus vinaceus TaxID=1080074 RepID=UPI0031EDD25F